MEQGDRCSTSESGSCGSEAGCGRKAQHAPQIIKGKWATTALDQSGDQDSFAGVAKALKCGGHMASIFNR